MLAVVEGTEEGGYVGDMVPDVVSEFASGALISREHVEDEIDLILRTLRELWSMEPDQAMRMLMAVSARLTEMAVHLHRLEGKREWRQIRTLQVERALAECDRQFKSASRMLEVRRQDIEMSK